MLRLPSAFALMVAVSPQAISTLEHHFDHHHGSDSGSSSGCSHSSSSSSSETPSASASVPSAHVFITHDLYPANLGGSNGADARCQAAASSAGLSGNFIALVSSGKTSGLSRVTGTRPFYTVNEELAYPTKSDFLATSFSSVTDEHGNPAATEVWSGSDANGLPSTHDCLSWTSVVSTDDATVGVDNNADLSAASGFAAGDLRSACSQSHALFCVQQ